MLRRTISGILACPILIFGAAASIAPVHAATPADSDDRLEEVVVTAQRRSENLQNVPVSVTAFSESVIRDAGIRSTSDLLLLTPNVTFDQSFTVGNSLMAIRGIQQVNNADPPVAFVVDGVPEGGILHVKGPNIMLGYLKIERPGEIEPPHSRGAGWYSTGDIVDIDADGFVRIQGRVKRFAKIAGEMISLEVVEKLAAIAAPEALHAAVTRPDAAKGEAIVLFTTSPDLTREQLSAAARANGAPELAVPRQLLRLNAIPVLGTGKTDYMQLKRLAEIGANT